MNNHQPEPKQIYRLIINKKPHILYPRLLYYNETSEYAMKFDTYRIYGHVLILVIHTIFKCNTTYIYIYIYLHLHHIFIYLVRVSKVYQLCHIREYNMV